MSFTVTISLIINTWTLLADILGLDYSLTSIHEKKLNVSLKY